MSREEERKDPTEDAADVTRRTTGATGAVGATAGAHLGAGAGAAAGPAGVVAGGAAGGLIGWIAGLGMRDDSPLEPGEDEHYRQLHESTTDERTMPYDHVRDLYRLGHEMGGHPQYGRREWHEIEPELREAWSASQRETWGEWPEASSYVRRAFEQRPD